MTFKAIQVKKIAAILFNVKYVFTKTCGSATGTKLFHHLNFFGLLFLLTCFQHSVAQKLQWAVTFPNNSKSVQPLVMTVSAANKIATAGLYGNNEGVFLTVIGSVGNILYGDTLMGRNAKPTGVCFDKYDNLYVCGEMKDTLIDGSLLFKGKSFIAKYNQQGQKVWLKIFQSGQINDVALDQLNRLHVLATFQDTATFFNQKYQSLGPSNLLLLRINSLGNIEKSKVFSNNVIGMKLRISDSGKSMIFAKHYDILTVDTFTTESFENGFEFVAKIDTMFSLIFFHHVCNGPFDDAEDFSATTNEVMAVSGTMTHHGSYSLLEIFDTNGALLPSPPKVDPALRYCEKGAKIAFAGMDDLWSFHRETYYKGHRDNPDSVWNKLSLNKIDKDGGMLLWHPFDISNGPRAIAGGSDGGIYIASCLPSGYSLAIQGYTLTNFSTSSNKLFIAKFFDDGNHVGLIEITNPKKATVFPNPASGLVTIQFQENSNEPRLINIENNLGQVVSSTIADGMDMEFSIQLSELSAGLYFVKVNQACIARFIKE